MLARGKSGKGLGKGSANNSEKKPGRAKEGKGKSQQQFG